MEPLVEVHLTGIDGLNDHVDRIAAGIDYGRARDTDFRVNVPSPGAYERSCGTGRNRSLSGCGAVGAIEEIGMPKLHAWVGIRVKRVHAVMLGGHDDYIMLRPIYGYIGNPQRLRVDRAVGTAREELSECGGINVRRSECILLPVDAIAGQIIMVGQDARQIGHGDTSGPGDSGIRHGNSRDRVWSCVRRRGVFARGVYCSNRRTAAWETVHLPIHALV